MREMDPPSWSPDELRARLAACRQCAEAGYFIGGTPLLNNGPLPAPLFVLGQAPAAVHAEEPTTRPFSPGRHGQPSPLWSWLARAGWSEENFRACAYMTAITRCYPGAAPSGTGDRRPSAAEQAMCRPFWTRELQLAEPRLILTLGTMALHALGLRGKRLREAVGQVYDIKLAGRSIPVVPLPHPSGVSRWLNDPAHQALLDQALGRVSALTRSLALGGPGAGPLESRSA